MLRSMKKVQGRYRLMWLIASSGRSSVSLMACSTTAILVLSISSGSSQACMSSMITVYHAIYAWSMPTRDFSPKGDANAGVLSKVPAVQA